MDFNTFMYRLGIDPGCFKNQMASPIQTPQGFIWEVEQRDDERTCPFCGSRKAIINDHDTVEINCSDNSQIRDVLRIRKVRFRCKDCGRTFTPPIHGIDRYSKTSRQTIGMILSDFHSMMTFRDIGLRYGLSTSRILEIFDENIKAVPRRSLPVALCIDEIRFNGEYDQKYCCVLYDYDRREIVDIIQSRQIAYLEEYFGKIPEKERNGVRYFISDMYDGYATIRRKYLPKALPIVDLFHVVKQLTNEVGKARVKAMKALDRSSLSYRFMKSHWKLFLCRKENIPDRLYTSRKTGEQFHYDDLLFDCLKEDKDLLEGYNALQDLYRYKENFYTFKEAYDFIWHLSDRLLLSGNEGLEGVGRTYRKWIAEIASGLSKSQSGRRYTNGIAESINNHLKTIIKTAYGYRNFDRFRKRAMMIITYRPDKKSRR